MALTTFVDFSDPKVTAAWLNGVDQVVNGTLGSNIAAPASGDILVGDGVSFVNKQLVAGANVTITQGVGTVTVTTPGTAGFAPIASPAFTGNPTAPTPTVGDNDTSIATTAFVTAACSNSIGITIFNNALTFGGMHNLSIPMATTDVWVMFSGGPGAASTVNMTLPPSPFDGQRVSTNFTNTGTSISALVPLAGGGVLVKEKATGRSLALFGSVTYRYSAAQNTWFPHGFVPV